MEAFLKDRIKRREAEKTMAMLQNRLGFASNGTRRLSHYPVRYSCMYEGPASTSNTYGYSQQNHVAPQSTYQRSLWPGKQRWQNQMYSSTSNNVYQRQVQQHKFATSPWQSNTQYPSSPWRPNNQHVPWQPDNTFLFQHKQEPVDTCTRDFIESFFTDMPAMEPQVPVPTNGSMLTSPLEANPIQSLLNGEWHHVNLHCNIVVQFMSS